MPMAGTEGRSPGRRARRYLTKLIDLSVAGDSVDFSTASLVTATAVNKTLNACGRSLDRQALSHLGLERIAARTGWPIEAFWERRAVEAAVHRIELCGHHVLWRRNNLLLLELDRRATQEPARAAQLLASAYAVRLRRRAEAMPSRAFDESITSWLYGEGFELEPWDRVPEDKARRLLQDKLDGELAADRPGGASLGMLWMRCSTMVDEVISELGWEEHYREQHPLMERGMTQVAEVTGWPVAALLEYDAMMRDQIAAKARGDQACEDALERQRDGLERRTAAGGVPSAVAQELVAAHDRRGARPASEDPVDLLPTRLQRKPSSPELAREHAEWDWVNGHLAGGERQWISIRVSFLFRGEQPGGFAFLTDRALYLAWHDKIARIRPEHIKDVDLEDPGVLVIAAHAPEETTEGTFIVVPDAVEDLEAFLPTLRHVLDPGHAHRHLS